MVAEWDVWSAWADSAAARAADINDIYDSWLALFEQLAMQHVGSKRRLPRPRLALWVPYNSDELVYHDSSQINFHPSIHTNKRSRARSCDQE